MGDDVHGLSAASRRALFRGIVPGVLLFLALLTPIAPASVAAEPGLGPRRIALVIGNGKYENVPTLPNPRRDAEAVAATLERLEFDVTRVIDGDQQALARAIKAFSVDKLSSDIALFYFAGHGIQINGENYLLPTSIRSSEPEAIIEQSLSLNEVRTKLRNADPGLAIIILDSCRDNPFGPMVTEKTGESGKGLYVGTGLAETTGAAGMLIAYATQPGEFAYDGLEEHSPFTAALLSHLEQPGLEIRLMLGRVREEVVAQTNGSQVPWVEEAVLGEFYFADPREGETATAGGAIDGHDLAFWRSIWRSDDPRDYEAYLSEFPEGAFAILASNRLDTLKLAEGRVKNAAAKVESAALGEADWRLVKNSLFWLGFYNGPLGGATDPSVAFAIQAFRHTLDLAPSGKLTDSEIKQLHFAAANSLISMGERLADQIVFERARLRGIDRGISEIALPAYEELVRRTRNRQGKEKILSEAKAQVEAMMRQRASLERQFEQASQQYLTLVTAAGSGYEDYVSAARRSHIRAGGTEGAADTASRPRRQVFLQHALDYAKKGVIDEDLWIKELY